jgi:hypothetical protein
MRDDFSSAVKELLAKRVGYRCSNPNCRQPTSGPQEDPSKSVNVGVAAHITAASLEGPRYDEALTQERRKDVSNGIWLCQKCAKLVDNDSTRYTVEKLLEWKGKAEETAILEIEGSLAKQDNAPSKSQTIIFAKLEKLMPDLLAEMKSDLAQYPFRREFVIMSKNWVYNGETLAYYFEDHSELEGKVRILQNYGLIQDITYNNVARYNIAEEFAEYLTGE